MQKSLSPSHVPRTDALRSLATLLRPHTLSFLLGLLFLAIGSAVNLIFPQLARLVTNPDHYAWLVNNPLKTSVLIIALFAIQSLAFYGRALLFGTLGHRVVTTLRSRLFESLLHRPIEFFDANRSGDLVSRVIADCSLIQDIVSIKLSVLIRYSLQVVVGVLLMAFISARLTLLLILGLPLLLLISMFLGQKLKRLSKELQRTLGLSASAAEEVFSGQRVIKAFNAEQLELARFNQINQQSLALGISRAKVAAFFSSFVNFLMNVFLVLVILYGTLLVAHQQLPLGDLMAFLLYAAIVGVSFAFLIGTYVEFTQALAGVSRAFELLSENSALPTPDLPTAKCNAPLGIKFQSVSFAYPTRPESWALRDFSCEIQPGSITALVGPSGAGKSSVVNLLLGFYQPQQGTLSIEPLTGSPDQAAAIRSAISYVPQDPTLFGISLRENLKLGNPSASDEELQLVLSELGLAPLLATLPHGLDTLPGDRALQLSGGQRQRIALARALLRTHAGLLILDEATSSIDSETEAKVQSALQARRNGKTTLIIAHRLATVRNADHILVLDKGSLTQQGTHESLMAVSGLYRSLVERQELK